jgi:pyruvate kinase
MFKLKKSKDELVSLIKQLSELRGEMLRLAENLNENINYVDPSYRKSAKNLIHYLALRRHDLRALQSELSELGLSSLGRSESHVLATIEAVMLTLSSLAKYPLQLTDDNIENLGFSTAKGLLEQHTKTLFGPRPKGRNEYIMVTMPSEAADDYELILNLLKKGMNCMRINCAHDSPDKWSQMIENLRRARKETGLDCRISMDLPGPKLRTGPLSPGPAVMKIRPRRNAYGKVIKPSRVLLTDKYEFGLLHKGSADAVLPVGRKWLKCLQLGDKIKFVDARRAQRSMTITEQTDEGFLAEARKTFYITPGTKLSCHENDETAVGNIPPQENFIALNPGDIIELTRDLGSGCRTDYKNQISPAVIGCTLPEVLDSVKSGEPILFDDGKISGIVEAKDDHGLKIRITRTSPQGGKLRTDKGINLPLTKLSLPALTSNDIPLLDFIVQHADIVGLSFANNPEDIGLLMQHIKNIDKGQPFIVLKIETRRGFENFPAMLLEAMKSPGCGVMIARGDLAVELGYERLAEVQEEILWLCEASHIPAIWATQVLENLAKQGAPTRAEITDAVMGHRAECVMLNKGPHILDALTVLDNILHRMEKHQFKKTSMLRELRLAYNLPYN